MSAPLLLPRDSVNIAVARQLMAAAALLRKAGAQLDQEGSPCEKCGRTTHRNWPHAQIGKQLSAMVHKLGRFAEELRDLERENKP